MSCNNCFNGCTETVSDQCIKYTGLSVPVLGINNGDTLASVELAITTYLVNALNGSAIFPIIDQSTICNVISKYLAECAGCDGLSLNELLAAMIKAVCDLQVQINATNATIAALEDAYDVDCLEGVVSDSGTHDILQATIDKLCEINTSLTEVIASLTTYVTAAQVKVLIADYLANDPTQSLVSTKMVPYTVVPFLPTLTILTNFDSTGAGTGDWINIYLCNGFNPGVPDLRGRALVGVTNGIPGGTMSPEVNPGGANPSYTQGITFGANSVALNVTQMPNHTHTVTINNSTAHSHYMAVSGTETSSNANSLYDGTFADRNELGLVTRALPLGQDDNFDYELVTTAGTINAGKTSDSGIHTHTNSVTNTGGGLGHDNIQPVYASNFIIYIPA